MTAKEIEKKTQSILQYIIDNAPDTNDANKKLLTTYILYDIIYTEKRKGGCYYD